jgi:hypothetical protein
MMFTEQLHLSNAMADTFLNADAQAWLKHTYKVRLRIEHAAGHEGMLMHIQCDSQRDIEVSGSQIMTSG